MFILKLVKRSVILLSFFIICLVSFYFFLANKTEAQINSPTLNNFWEGRAKFSQEERVRFPGTPYNRELDFYYNTHDSGMAIIEDINNPGIIYYLAESWKGGNPTHLEPHLYKSTDGGKTFTHLTKLFDVLGTNETTCPLNSTYAYWANLNSQAKWCLFQMREPDIMFYNGYYYLVFESAAKAESASLIGPTVVKLPNLEITQPVTVQHGVNFRQHPLFTTYDGDPNKPGLQETSASTPFWSNHNNGLYVFWAGVHPINVPLTSQWEMVDTYRGHFTSIPGLSEAYCTDPILCYFSFDEFLITNTNFRHLPSSSWETKSANGLSIIKEGNYRYMLYIGGDIADITIPQAKKGGVSIVRSSDLINWERKFSEPEDIVLYADKETYPNSTPAFYAKLVKISGEYYVYYYRCGPPVNPADGMPIARTYRMKLSWIRPSLPLLAGWNETTWPDVSGRKASDTPTECPISVAKENLWFKPYVRDFGGVDFGLENGKTYWLKCNQEVVWQL